MLCAIDIISFYQILGLYTGSRIANLNKLAPSLQGGLPGVPYGIVHGSKG